MKKTRKKKKNQKLVPFLVGVLMVIGLGSCVGGGGEEAPPATEPTTIITEATDPTELVTEAPTEIVTEATVPPATEPPTEAPTEAPVTEPPTEAPTEASTPEPQTTTYVLNTNTKKFHYPSCGSAKKIKEHNKSVFEGTREEVMNMGYEPCGNCHP